MPNINGTELTWEDLDAFALTTMSAEQLKQYQRDDRIDFCVILKKEEGVMFFDKSAKQKEFRIS